MESDLFSVHFTPLAFEDLDEIDSYLSDALCNPQAAEKLLHEMQAGINRLRTFPMSGSSVDDPYLAAKGYRKLVVQNYLVLHLIDQEQHGVVIMRIVHGAREYHNLL